MDSATPIAANSESVLMAALPGQVGEDASSHAAGDQPEQTHARANMHLDLPTLAQENDDSALSSPRTPTQERWHQAKVLTKQYLTLSKWREARSFNAKLYGNVTPHYNGDENSEFMFPKKRCILYPDSPWRNRWDFVIALLLVYTVVVLPWRLAFQDSYDAVDVIVDTLFLIDIVLTFFTAYRSKDVYVTNYKAIAKRYLKTWFTLDVLATFPFYFVVDSSASRASTLLRVPRLFKIFRLLRLLKLFRIARAQQKLKRFEDSADIHPGIFRLTKLSLWFLTSLHVCSCIWIFISNLERDTNNNEGWVTRFDFQDESNLGVYHVSVYWCMSVLTTTGFGDIVPTSHLERFYANLLLAVAIIFVAYTTATVASIMQSFDVKQAKFREQMETLHAFMMSAKLPPTLRVKLRRYFRLQSDHNMHAATTESILSQIPSKLRRETALAMHVNFISKCPFLAEVAETDFVAEVVMNMRPATYQADERIFSYDEPVTEWCIVQTGRVEFQSQRDGYPYMAFHPGSTFGEIGLLLTGTWANNVVATQATSTFVVKKRDLYKILSNYPTTKFRMQEVARKRQQKLLQKKHHRGDSFEAWTRFKTLVDKTSSLPTEAPSPLPPGPWNNPDNQKRDQPASRTTRSIRIGNRPQNDTIEPLPKSEPIAASNDSPTDEERPKSAGQSPKPQGRSQIRALRARRQHTIHDADLDQDAGEADDEAMYDDEHGPVAGEVLREDQPPLSRRFSLSQDEHKERKDVIISRLSHRKLSHLKRAATHHSRVQSVPISDYDGMSVGSFHLLAAQKEANARIDKIEGLVVQSLEAQRALVDMLAKQHDVGAGLGSLNSVKSMLQHNIPTMPNDDSLDTVRQTARQHEQS